ncbi:MAG: hypothetical protein DRP06_04530 [Candidatus Aenigmatarchaeota archaeon]|nr:MAG: hypothetical protein DRP06_04530 [Candidatus Aenigmarchaeota archaeon]
MAGQEELQKKAQEIYMHIEMLNKEFEQISMQYDVINSKIKESAKLRKDVKGLIAGEGFSKMGSGVLVPSIITDDNSFLVNVGRKLFVKMDKIEVDRHIEEKIKGMESVLPQVSGRRKELQDNIQKHMLELQTLQQ